MNPLETSFDDSERRLRTAVDRMVDTAVPWRFIPWHRAYLDWLDALAEHRRLRVRLGMPLPRLNRRFQRAMRRRDAP